MKFKKLHPNAVTPTRAHKLDAGLDITATEIKQSNDLFVEYGTGWAVKIPDNHVGLLFPRSSISNKTLMLSNCVGVIDSEFTGEFTFRFRERFGTTPETRYKPGDRIGQLVVVPCLIEDAEIVDELPVTKRNLRGYGSSGV